MHKHAEMIVQRTISFITNGCKEDPKLRELSFAEYVSRLNDELCHREPKFAKMMKMKTAKELAMQVADGVTPDMADELDKKRDLEMQNELEAKLAKSVMREVRA